jgi:hypothetical protein
MIIDMRVYSYQPSQFMRFLELYRTRGYAITERHLGKTVGVLTSASGLANRTFQFFAYRDSDHRDECRVGLRSDPEWKAFISEAAPAIAEQTNTILAPTDFSGLKDFKQLDDRAWLTSQQSGGMLFELRTCTAWPGRLSEALDLMATEGARLTHKHVERPIGHFTTETGVANQVLMLWAYASAGERDRRRKAMLTDPAFREFGQRFDPLVSHEESVLLTPVPYSPLR